MTELKPAAEVAREIGFGLASRKHDEGLEWLADYITARDLEVTRKVIEALDHAVAMECLKNRWLSKSKETEGYGCTRCGQFRLAIRTLDPAKILEEK